MRDKLTMPVANSSSSNGAQKDRSSLIVKVPTSSQPLTEIPLSDYKPQRFGLKYAPPTIVLEYLVPSSGKLYHHKMRVGIEFNSNLQEVATNIMKKHSKYFSHSDVSLIQIEKLVSKLYHYKFANSDLENAHDKLAIAKKEENKKEHSVANNIGLQLKQASTKNNTIFHSSKQPNIDYNKLDLCKLTDDELDQHKKKMDEIFEKNNIDIKDAKFRYDIEMEIKPTGKSEWDDDADDDF